MMKISVIIPDNYYIENVIKRIEQEFNDPNIVVVADGKLEEQLGQVVAAVAEFQQKLKEISAPKESV